jgi:hypothetical protein
MSWRRVAKAIGSEGFDCLSYVLMWTFVMPGTCILLLLAWWSGDVLLQAGAVAFALLMLGLYLLATWD